MKKLTALLLALLLCLTLTACPSPDADGGSSSTTTPTAPNGNQPNESTGPAAKTFTKGGMTVTLTEAFTETSMAGYTAAYDSAKIAILAIKEAFTLMEGFEDYTLDEYGELVISANQLSNVSLQKKNGLTWFEYDYENTDMGKTYHYYSYVFKTQDAFWTVQFACLVSDVDTCAPLIADYAKSVSFA